MLSNILLFTFEATSPEQIANAPPLFKIGPLNVSSFAVTMGIISALITMPVNFLVIFVFTGRERYVPAAIRSIQNTTEKYKQENLKFLQSLKNDEDEEEGQSSDEKEKMILRYSFFLGFFNLQWI